MKTDIRTSRARRIVVATLALFALLLSAGATLANDALQRQDEINSRVERAVRNLSQKLDLNNLQSEKLRARLGEHFTKVQRLRVTYRDWPELEGRTEFKRELTQLQTEMYNEMSDFLSEDQLVELKRLRAKNSRRAAAAQEPL